MSDPIHLQLAAVLATWAATYLLHSTVLLALVSAVARLRALPPVVHDVLWKTALVAGLVTATTAVGAPRTDSIGTELFVKRTISEGVHVETGVDASTAPRIVLTGERPPMRQLPSDFSWAPPGSSTRVEATVATTRTGPGGWPLLGLLTGWLLVAGFGIVRLLVLRRRLTLLCQHFAEPAPRTERLFEEMARGVEGARVVRCDAVSAPCVLPGRTVAVPGRCEREMTDAEMRAVLGHEIAHVARDDVRWTGFLSVVTTLLWIQPLNRYALSQVREAAELICDDWALSRTDDSYGLAAAISRVAEWAAGGTAYGVAMTGDTRRLSERVRRILHGQRATPGPRWVTPAAAALLLLPALWLPVVRAGAEQHEVRVEQRTLVVADTLGSTPVGARSHTGRRIVIASPWRG